MKKLLTMIGAVVDLTAKALAAAVAVTCAATAFAAKPYDVEVEYLEAPVNASGKVSYIDTGLYPANDLGVKLRVTKLSSSDSTICGVEATNRKWYFGFGNTCYLSWDSANPPINDANRPLVAIDSTYDIYFNHLNDRTRRVLGVGNATDFNLPITTTWSASDASSFSIYLFAYNNKGTPGNTGNVRIFSAQFTRGASIVMDLVPVRKDGVGYMYDKVSGTLFAKVANSSLPDFTYVNDVADESYIEGTITLDADANWTSRGILRLDSSAVIDLNGHSLTIAGAFGDGTIKDSSSGVPGTLRISSPLNMEEPFTATTSGNLTVLRSHKPYDAQVEYLEAPLSGDAVPYIDTGLKPADDLGVRLRVAPLRPDETTVCGAMATVKVNKKNVDWRWYMGFKTSTGGYLTWGTANPDQRFSYSANTIYDILFNHLNSRNRRVEEVVGTYSFDLPITEPWPAGANQNIYLFAYNNKGAAGNTGNARIYSAQFTQGGKVVMDLIPVRKNGVGYMYDKVSDKLLAKVPTAPLDFTYENDATDEAYIEGTVMLDADADWTSRGILSIDPSATIDLNGHSLTIAGAYGTGTITNSSETLGEVRFVIPERMEHTSDIRLLGNLKVVKEGEGTLSLNRAGQTFTGGFEVMAGVASAVANENGSYWGASGGVIRVSSGATFSVNGKNNFYYKDFVLNGGTLVNNTKNMSSTDGIGNVTLEADSAVNIGEYVVTYFASPNPATFDLGGHKLTVNAGTGGQFNISFPIVNGTLEYETGGYLCVPEGASSGSTTFDLKMIGAAFYGDGTLSVSNYLASYSQRWNHGSYQVKVYGTFKPDAVDTDGREYFHGCEMQPGSTIDLSEKTATWDTMSTGWDGTGDADGARTVTFAEGARVTLDLHGRTLAKGEKIVSWSDVPANLNTLTFVLDAETAESGESLVVTDSGIYYGADENTVAHAYWTGAIDNDLTKPGNWTCTNFMGNAVADGVPGASSAVHVSGEVGFQIPAAQPLTCDSITFSDVTLTNDCDWSGLEWAITANIGDTVNLGSVDLNGYKLRLATPSSASTFYDYISLAVSDGSVGDPGELHLEVPSASAKLICTGLALSGNVKLVKDGSGDLAMTRANQTFTGGVLIAEGRGYLPGQAYSETGSYWGANGGVITVVTNATFDVCGNNGFYTKNFVLNGGTLDCSATISTDDGKYGIGNVTLIADSQFPVSVNSKTAIFSDPAGAAKIDLGGHTLTVQLGTGSQMLVPVPIENGTLSGVSGGYLRLKSGTSGGSDSVNLEMSGTAFYTEGRLSVSNYLAQYTERWNHGVQPLIVYGTFTPAAVDANGKEYFHGCVMQNGSCIDLSGKTTVWSVVSTGWPVTGYEGDADGSRTITFANDAKVGILLGNRKLRSEEKIIDWSSAVPANSDGLTFFGQFSDGCRIPLKAEVDGLYAPKMGFIIIVE